MIKAVIFDMDGVISDTEDSWAKVNTKLLGDYGFKITSDEYKKRFAGVKIIDVFKETVAKKGIKYDDEEVISRMYKDINIALKKESIKEIPGAINLIKNLKKNKFSLAVASTCYTEFIEIVLTKLDILTDFDAVASIKEVKNGKPAPDVFLLAAKKLNVKPNECLVIEDALSGIIAANKAGMVSIAITTTSKKNVFKNKADLIISSLSELTKEKIEGVKKCAA